MPNSMAEMPDPDQFGWQKVKGGLCFLPSPEEIRNACEVIQARWSATERYKRATAMPDSPQLPPSDCDRVETPTVAIDAA